ncbi:MAG: hypothetical protein ACI84D_002721 [Thalassolituus oleivorans]|jgi:hypothetical protein
MAVGVRRPEPRGDLRVLDPESSKLDCPLGVCNDCQPGADCLLPQFSTSSGHSTGSEWGMWPPNALRISLSAGWPDKLSRLRPESKRPGSVCFREAFHCLGFKLRRQRIPDRCPTVMHRAGFSVAASRQPENALCKDIRAVDGFHQLPHGDLGGGPRQLDASRRSSVGHQNTFVHELLEDFGQEGRRDLEVLSDFPGGYVGLALVRPKMGNGPQSVLSSV